LTPKQRYRPLMTRDPSEIQKVRKVRDASQASTPRRRRDADNP
jgi:hypothetical protein